MSNRRKHNEPSTAESNKKCKGVSSEEENMASVEKIRTVCDERFPAVLIDLIVSYIGRQLWSFLIFKNFEDELSLTNFFTAPYSPILSVQNLKPLMNMQLTIVDVGNLDSLSVYVVPRMYSRYGGINLQAYCLEYNPLGDFHLNDSVESSTNMMCVGNDKKLSSGSKIEIKIRPATESDDCFKSNSSKGYRGVKLRTCSSKRNGRDCGTCDGCGYVSPMYDQKKHSIVTFECNGTPLGHGEKYRELVKRRIPNELLSDYCIRIDFRGSGFSFYCD